MNNYLRRSIGRFLNSEDKLIKFIRKTCKFMPLLLIKSNEDRVTHIEGEAL